MIIAGERGSLVNAYKYLVSWREGNKRGEGISVNGVSRETRETVAHGVKWDHPRANTGGGALTLCATIKRRQDIKTLSRVSTPRAPCTCINMHAYESRAEGACALDIYAHMRQVLLFQQCIGAASEL